MNCKFILLFSLIYSSTTSVLAERGNDNIVLKNLLQDKKPIACLGWPSFSYFEVADSFYRTYAQNLIKTDSAIYVFINGTGRLYKLNALKNTMQFNRIDVSHHFGYNYGAFAFGFNNRIYNLGGYGIWRYNGQLRVFNEKAQQWDIVKLNKEIPILTGKDEGLVWYDVAGKKIYTAYYQIRNEAVKKSDLEETEFIFEVMVLDLQTNEWFQVGSLSEFLKKKLQLVKPITLSPWGLMVSIAEKIALLDFKNNQILSLDNRKVYYQSLTRTGLGSMFYFKDSTLFYTSNNNLNLDSVPIHYSDFISLNQPLYSKDNGWLKLNKNILVYLLLLVIISLSIIKILLIWKQKSTREPIQFSKKTLPLVDIALNGSNVFDEMETQLLELLLKNSISGNTTSIDEQNKVLGLNKKSAEIQKKQRSDNIISINRKFSLITKNQDSIIQKRRTQFDKRAYEYFINFNRIDELKKIIAPFHVQK